MTALHLALLLLGTSPTFASPALIPRQETVYATQTVPALAPISTAWDAGAVRDFTIHASCNNTEAAQIKRGLDETITLVTHARDHILRWGNSSDIY